MSFIWKATLAPQTFTNDEDLDAAGINTVFESREDAETWLGENYMELHDLDVQTVALYEDDRCVMEPMSLEA